MAEREVYWQGAVGECDGCGWDLNKESEFYDAKTKHGPWGTLCAKCFDILGIGVGTGRGQHYRRQEDGKFKKVAG